MAMNGPEGIIETGAATDASTSIPPVDPPEPEAHASMRTRIASMQMDNMSCGDTKAPRFDGSKAGLLWQAGLVAPPSMLRRARRILCRADLAAMEVRMDVGMTV